MDFKLLVERSLEIRKKYSELEKKRFGREWTSEQLMQGFVGDVGDLSKLILAKEGVKAIDDVDGKLAHELADCLWSVIILANTYNIDLESAFSKTMNELEKKIATNV